LNIPPTARKIVLVGNPNVGKSVFFNALTGVYADVSNYPGTTLEVNHGSYGQDVILDTPGIYGVAAFNDEEIVARDVIRAADLVVNIVDSVHLDRDLFLTQQIIDLGLPVIVALNMLDEAQKEGLLIDHKKLSAELGVPVIPTVATLGRGLAELKAGIEQAQKGHVDPWLEEQLGEITANVGNQADALLILEGDPDVSSLYNRPPGNLQEEIYTRRRRRVDAIVAEVTRETLGGASFGAKLSRLMLKPVTGLVFLAAALFLIYEFIGVFVAQTLVGVTEVTVMQGWYEPLVRSLVGVIFPENSFFGTLLIGEFGILTMTVTYILGLLLPLVLGFYLVLSIMEDTGYLPRIATLVDRLLMKIGLNGRGIIPIILGMGCVTMATITTRLLGSERERTIATFLLALAIPCSAQLAVIVSMLAPLGWPYVALYSGIVLAVLIVVGTLLNRFLPGSSSDLLIDLPPLRLPHLKNVLRKTWTKTSSFLKEATPLFALGALIISLLQVSGALTVMQDFLSPLTVGWLQLPKEAANAFIMGFVRRDFGAAGLFGLELTSLQVVVALVTITMFVPCIASALVIFKERGQRQAVSIWLSVLVMAFFIGGLISQILI